MLHTLFTLEHNYICDLLSHEYPDSSDERLYRKAKLINSALMAKIHTVEWTPAILPHPIVQLAMNVNWRGLASEDAQKVLEFLNDSELVGGIVGSNTEHHAAPYSLTEEFVAVYRMHPLMADDYASYSARDRAFAGEADVAGDRRAAHTSGRRTLDDAGPLLFVRHVSSRCRDSSQLPAAFAESHA